MLLLNLEVFISITKQNLPAKRNLFLSLITNNSQTTKPAKVGQLVIFLRKH